MQKLKALSPSFYLPLGAAIVILFVSRHYQGKWSERWETFPELQIYSQQLQEIPKDVGEWEGQKTETLDEKTMIAAGAEGEVSRVYRNASGQEVRVSIICARLRDVFYHTPDRCYPAAGFEMQGEPQPEVFEIGNDTADFFTTTFLKTEPTGSHRERGYWSWTADGKWIAPKNPKLAFAGQKALYKLYVFANVPPNSKEKSNEGLCVDFIRVFMPALDASLRPAMEKAGYARQQVAEAKPAK